MKKIERFIFDLDGTLLFGNYQKEQEYFKDKLKDDADLFLEQLFPLLNQYEKTFPRYNVNQLATFLTVNSKALITSDIVEGWIEVNRDMEDKIEDNAIEVLEYLKSKNKSIAVLTNWFKKTQLSRLENSGILPYIDDIYGGEIYLKPNIESYLNAMGKYKIDECIMIGDTLEKDYLGPKRIGMEAIYYNPNGIEEETKIKSLIKIKERY